jgi:hypothetical protein
MIVVTKSGERLYGPFVEVVETAAHLMCDGATLPRNVIGSHTIRQDDTPGPAHLFRINAAGDYEAIPQPQPVPAEVTMRQARLALLEAGKLGAVASAIAALASPAKEAAGIEWEYSNSVQRRNGFVEQLAPALGMTGADIDALFILAATK